MKLVYITGYKTKAIIRERERQKERDWIELVEILNSKHVVMFSLEALVLLDQIMTSIDFPQQWWQVDSIEQLSPKQFQGKGSWQYIKQKDKKHFFLKLCLFGKLHIEENGTNYT